MQHKGRRKSRMGIFLVGLAVAAVGSLGVLMTREPPAPQHVITQQLDAKAFLGQTP